MPQQGELVTGQAPVEEDAISDKMELQTAVHDRDRPCIVCPGLCLKRPKGGRAKVQHDRSTCPKAIRRKEKKRMGFKVRRKRRNEFRSVDTGDRRDLNHVNRDACTDD